MNEDFREVFSAIDEVPWPNLTHAYGPAIDIPHLIRALTSPDLKVRNESWYELHENLWHQGTIYQATAHAVPIFMRLLENPSTAGKYEILAYLALLFTGRSYWDVHKDLEISRSIGSRPDLEPQLERELQWVAATKRAVIEGRDQYLSLLKQGDPGTKVAAAYLLGVIGAVDIDALEAITEAAESA